MKPHLTSSSTAIAGHVGNQDGMAEVLAHPVSIGDRIGRATPGQERARLTLASMPVWRHKLILTGRLDHRTVVELEDEIECLCEEGVRILTLDLCRLEAIDSVGASAIALHGETCRRQGRDFEVIPGSSVVHHALTEAGAESLVAGHPGRPGVLRLTASALKRSPCTTTVTIKVL